MSTNKSMEEYRRLADKCRETSRTVSAENGRAELLAMAEIWDFLADHVGTRPSLWNGGQRPLVFHMRRVALQCVDGRADLALLWQNYSCRCPLQIHFRQCGHRCGGIRAKSSRMA